jgi:hypothetical protein
MAQSFSDPGPHERPRSRAGWWWRLLGLSELYDGPRPSEAAEERAIALLKDHLSTEQRIQYEQHSYFDVIGGVTGRRYRIRHGTQMNVHLLDSSGRWISSLCFAPRGRLPVGDMMLAQAIALQIFEYDALNVANNASHVLGFAAPRLRS